MTIEEAKMDKGWLCLKTQPADAQRFLCKFKNGKDYEIKQIRPKTSILFLTAYKEYAFDAWDTGASGFLLKPLDAEEILRQLPKLRYPVKGLM